MNLTAAPVLYEGMGAPCGLRSDASEMGWRPTRRDQRANNEMSSLINQPFDIRHQSFLEKTQVLGQFLPTTDLLLKGLGLIVDNPLKQLAVPLSQLI